MHAAPIVTTAASGADTRALDPVLVGTLPLAHPGPDGVPFLSAASGMAIVGGAAWMVSDTLAQPARFAGWGAAGTIQQGLEARKHKYDLESITALTRDAKGGAALLALGSGSNEHRGVGLLQDVDAAGRATGAARAVDLSELYGELGRHVAALNIEGATVRSGLPGGELLLFHRGQVPGDASRVFVLDAAAVAKAARVGKPVPPSALRSHHAVDLGTLDGNRLAFSDARALPDGRIVFSASAEDSKDHSDGVIVGSAIGMLDRDLNVLSVRPLTGTPRKVEGIALATDFDPAAPAGQVLMVTDPDDPAVSGERLQADLG
jgi:hypothetical protein